VALNSYFFELLLYRSLKVASAVVSFRALLGSLPLLCHTQGADRPSVKFPLGAVASTLRTQGLMNLHFLDCVRPALKSCRWGRWFDMLFYSWQAGNLPDVARMLAIPLVAFWGDWGTGPLSG